MSEMSNPLVLLWAGRDRDSGTYLIMQATARLVQVTNYPYASYELDAWALAIVKLHVTSCILLSWMSCKLHYAPVNLYPSHTQSRVVKYPRCLQV